MLLVQNPSGWSQKCARTLGWSFLLLNLLVWQRVSWAAGAADPACRARTEGGCKWSHVCIFSASTIISTCIILLGRILKTADQVSCGPNADRGAGKAPSTLHGKPGGCWGHPCWQRARDWGERAASAYAQLNAFSLVVDLFSSCTFHFFPGDKRKISADLHMHKGKQNHILNLMQAILIISHCCYVNYYYCCTKGL